MFRKNEKGNPKFSQLHFLITLKIIAENQPIGRRRLLKRHSITNKGENFLKANSPVASKVLREALTAMQGKLREFS